MTTGAHCNKRSYNSAQKGRLLLKSSLRLQIHEKREKNFTKMVSKMLQQEHSKRQPAKP
jgi:hypothetical protein